MKKLDIQGHRGCRGLMPENSLPAFEHAIKLGVHTLEFDVVISKDKKVIVSHEPFMSHDICITPEQRDISKSNEMSHNIYELTYDQIKNYDCGSKYFARFPDQQKLNTHKPALQEVINRAEKLNENILYNIEIKSRPEWDEQHHPSYQEFADLVVEELTSLGVLQKTTVQCFDVRTLQYINRTYPHVRLVYLIENMRTPKENLDTLGFVPFVYSPYFKLVDHALVEFCNTQNMQLIPWTVNEKSDMEDQIKLGVDGIITDYPDRLINILKN